MKTKENGFRIILREKQQGQESEFEDAEAAVQQEQDDMKHVKSWD